MKKLASILCAGIVFLTSPYSKATTCGLSLDTSNVSLQYQQSNKEIQQKFWVSKPASATQEICQHYFITVNAPITGGQRRLSHTLSHDSQINYSIYKKPNRTGSIKDLPTIHSQNQLISGKFSGGAPKMSHDLYYYFHFERDELNLPKSGDYKDRVIVNLYSGTWQSKHQIEDTQTIVVNTQVPKTVSIKLNAPGAAFEKGSQTRVMDFGELKKGKQQALVVQVNANTGYELKVNSHNLGKLKHQTLKEYVSYSLTVDGKQQFAQKSQNLSTNSAYKNRLRQHKVEVTIGDVSDKIAGQYRDYVTITATAN